MFSPKLILICSLVATVTLPVVYFLFLLFFTSRSFPNTYFVDEDISFKDKRAVELLVGERIRDFENRKIAFEVDDENIEADLEELGIELDREKTLKNIFEFGKSGSIRENLDVTLKTLFGKSVFYPIYHIDPSVLSNSYDTLLSKFEDPAVDSSILVERLVPRILSENSGTVIDRTKLLVDLANRIEHLSLSPIELAFIEQKPRVLAGDSIDALARVQTLRNQRLVLSHETDVWRLEGWELLNLLEFYPEGLEDGFYLRINSESPIVIRSLDLEEFTSMKLQVLLNRDSANKFINEIAAGVNRPTVNATLKFENGKVSEFVPAQDGQALDIDRTNQMILDFISNDNEISEKEVKLSLPVEVETAKIASKEINDLGIQTLIGKGVSYFAGSIPNRVGNLSLGASRVSGTLVAPGEVFSFNGAVGEVSGKTGYKQAYVISKGRTVLDDGGGICQVSTTVFRAALNAGLPIVARTAHAYRVSYYEQGGFKPGFDATVWAPAVDLQFKNDTDHHILVQIVVDRSRAKMEVDLYGTNEGRKVEISDPVLSNFQPALPDLHQDDPTLPKGSMKQVDFAASGITSVFKRKVTKGDVVTVDETITSRFRPWQAIFLVGTGG